MYPILRPPEVWLLVHALLHHSGVLHSGKICEFANVVTTWLRPYGHFHVFWIRSLWRSFVLFCFDINASIYLFMNDRWLYYCTKSQLKIFLLHTMCFEFNFWCRAMVRFDVTPSSPAKVHLFGHRLTMGAALVGFSETVRFGRWRYPWSRF